MVERVARAICKRTLMKAGLAMAFEGQASPRQLTTATLKAVDEHWPDFVPEAREAIAAMREPTAAMSTAGSDDLFESALSGLSDQVARDVYCRMIDAALK